MTIAELIRDFKVLVDKEDRESFPDLQPEHIKLFLDPSATRKQKQIYGRTNPKREGFEESRKRKDDLRLLVKTGTSAAVQNPSASISSGEGLEFKVWEATFPSDYRFLLKTLAKVVYADCSDEETYVEVSPKEVQQDDVYAAIIDPFNRPTVLRPLAVTEGNLTQIYVPAGTSVPQIRLTYLRNPRSILTDPFYANENTEYQEFPSHVHDEIVREAVTLALEDLEAPRYQTSLNEEMRQE